MCASHRVYEIYIPLTPVKTNDSTRIDEEPSSVEIARAPVPNPKTPKLKRVQKNKKNKPGLGLNIKRSLKKISNKLTPGRQIATEAHDEQPTVTNLPTEITTTEDHYKKLFLPGMDKENPCANPSTYFIADMVEKPVENASASRQLLDILVLVSLIVEIYI